MKFIIIMAVTMMLIVTEDVVQEMALLMLTVYAAWSLLCIVSQDNGQVFECDAGCSTETGGC